MRAQFFEYANIKSEFAFVDLWLRLLSMWSCCILFSSMMSSCVELLAKRRCGRDRHIVTSHVAIEGFVHYGA